MDQQYDFIMTCTDYLIEKGSETSLLGLWTGKDEVVKKTPYKVFYINDFT